MMLMRPSLLLIGQVAKVEYDISAVYQEFLSVMVSSNRSVAEIASYLVGTGVAGQRKKGE